MNQATQEEAQFMVDWLNAVNEIHTGYLKPDSIYKITFNLAELERTDLWKKTFNEKSKWKVRVKKSGKLELLLNGNFVNNFYCDSCNDKKEVLT